MKVLEIKEAPEGFPGWNALTIEGRDKPVLVHWNWFSDRIWKGLPHLEVGQEVQFGISKEGVQYDFVKDFTVIE